MKIDLNTTWIAGKYESGEINVAYSYIEIYDMFEGESMFTQGEQADEVIKEIHEIWLNEDVDVNEAIEKYRNIYGY